MKKYRVYATDRETGEDHEFDIEARNKEIVADAAFAEGWLIRSIKRVVPHRPRPTKKDESWLPSGRSVVFWCSLLAWTAGLFVVWFALNVSMMQDTVELAEGADPYTAAVAAQEFHVASGMSVLMFGCLWLPIAFVLFICAVVTWPKKH